MKMKILKKKMRGKTDSLFYDKIAECKSKDGSNFWLDTCGEIRLTYKGKEYTGGSLGGKLDHIFDELTDKKLANEVEFENNDWFEVFTDTDFDLGDGYIAHDYDGAIESLKEAVTDYEMECKENEDE